MKPEELLYSKTHEWVHLSKENGVQIATVGISAYAVESLTDLVYMQLPAEGREVKAGEPLGEIESVKAVSDLYSPVTGKVIEVNTQLPNHLEVLNRDPYGDGWMVRIQLADDSVLSDLLDYPAYQKQIAEEGH